MKQHSLTPRNLLKALYKMAKKHELMVFPKNMVSVDIALITYETKSIQKRCGTCIEE